MYYVRNSKNQSRTPPLPYKPNHYQLFYFQITQEKMGQFS